MNIMDAYDRQMKLLPIVLDMERNGVKLSAKLADDLPFFESRFAQNDAYLRSIIGDEGSLGGANMVKKLLAKGMIKTEDLKYTATGRIQTGRAAIEAMVSDPDVIAALGFRSKLQKILSTYIRPWHEAWQTNGRAYPYFNQTRNDAGGGTRTGRFSSNFQQIQKRVDKSLGFPNTKTYIEPDDGHVVIARDFAAQEIRIAAHYAGGSLQQVYNKNPMVNIHNFVRDLIKNKTGTDLNRDLTKMASFLKLYSGGPQAMVNLIDISLAEAQAVFAAYDEAIPEFRSMSDEAMRIQKRGGKIRTWGGRRYAKEPHPSRDFSYKAGNLLIQGSAADMTAQAMIDYHYHPDRKGRLMLQVHDELVVSVPEAHWENEMLLLRWAMEESRACLWDVPIRSEGGYGPNYGDLIDYDDKRPAWEYAE